MTEPTTCKCGCGSEVRKTFVRGHHWRWLRDNPTLEVRGYRDTPGGLPYLEEDRGHETPCWIWQRGRRGTGYGSVWHDGRGRPAHRVYYERFIGPIPSGLELDHLCRVPLCVNPEHLEPVTTAENQRRGRAAKLTAVEVREIRALCEQGWVQNDIANAYGVSHPTVSFVKARKLWKDLV